MLYNNPATCGGVKIDVDTVARLAEIPNILGIKDSSGDLQNTNEMIRVVPRAFLRPDGPRHADLSGADVRRHGRGAGDGQHRAGLLAEIYKAFQRGDLEASKAAQLGSIRCGWRWVCVRRREQSRRRCK